jgi:hypothetical protein
MLEPRALHVQAGRIADMGTFEEVASRHDMSAYVSHGAADAAPEEDDAKPDAAPEKKDPASADKVRPAAA